MATITVRLIRSFEYRTIKSIVLHDVDLDQSIEDFVKHLAETIRTYPGLLPPFRTHAYDSLKIHSQPHGMKPNDLVTGFDDEEETILTRHDTKQKSLAQRAVINETELSFYKELDYESYKRNRTTKWA